MTWPPLPATGFIAGRSATVDDVDRGTAIFCQQADDSGPSQAFDVTVPQYAIWQEAGGADVPAILVQAERHITDPEGNPVFGLRLLDGQEVVADGNEVILLGEHVPDA